MNVVAKVCKLILKYIFLLFLVHNFYFKKNQDKFFHWCQTGGGGAKIHYVLFMILIFCCFNSVGWGGYLFLSLFIYYMSNIYGQKLSSNRIKCGIDFLGGQISLKKINLKYIASLSQQLRLRRSDTVIA